MLAGALRQWYRAQVTLQERVAVGTVLEPSEDVIMHTDLRWTQSMPSRFMAARVGQFLTGHFPTGVYLHRFRHLPSPLCTRCGVRDTREHMLLRCDRWSFLRARLREWMLEEGSHAGGLQASAPTWSWAYLVGSPAGRIWLGRFLVAVRPRWTMRDQFRPDPESSGGDSP